MFANTQGKVWEDTPTGESLPAGKDLGADTPVTG